MHRYVIWLNYTAKNVSTITNDYPVALYLHHLSTENLVQSVKVQKVHAVIVDYFITWAGNTVTVEIFLVMAGGGRYI